MLGRFLIQTYFYNSCLRRNDNTLVLVSGDDAHLGEALSVSGITMVEILINHFLKVPGDEGLDEPIIVSVGIALANPLGKFKNVPFSLETTLFTKDTNFRDLFSKKFIKNKVAILQLRRDQQREFKVRFETGIVFQ